LSIFFPGFGIFAVISGEDDHTLTKPGRVILSSRGGELKILRELLYFLYLQGRYLT